MIARTHVLAPQMRVLESLALGALVVSAMGCATLTRPVSSMADVKEDEKVLIGDIRFVDGDLGDWTSGLYMYSSVTFTNGQRGQALLMGSSPNFPMKGGVFHVAVGKQHQVHLAGISVHSTLFLVNVDSFLPIHVKLPRTNNACDYVGTFFVSKQGNRIVTKVVDTFERDKRTYARYVQGCRLQSAVEADEDEEEADEDEEEDDEDPAPAKTPTPPSTGAATAG